MELHRVRSLTESEKATREKAVRPPMNSLASYYSSGSSSIAGMSDTEEDEGEESWQDALEHRSSSRSSDVCAGPAESVKSCVDASDRNEHTRQDDQEEDDDDDSDLEPDHLRPSIKNSTARKPTGHVANGSIALDGVDIEALIASYRPLIHPAVAAHIDERHANILKSTNIGRSNSSRSTSSALPSPSSSRPSSSSSSSVVASSSKESFASTRPNAISRKNSSSSFTSLFSRNPGSSNKLQKEKSKQSKGKWVSGELPVYDEEGAADKCQPLPPHMKRSASASVAGSSLSQSTPMYASSSTPSNVTSQQLQYRSFSSNDVQPSRASLSSQGKNGVISSNGDSPRSSLSSSSTGTTARSSTSARSRGSFRWSVDSSASNATTKTSTSVPSSQPGHINPKHVAAEKHDSTPANPIPAEGIVTASGRRGSRHGHTVSIDSLDDFDKDSISSKDFPAPPLSRKNSTASSVFSLPSTSYTRPRNDSIASTTSASGQASPLPLSNVVRSSPLSPGLSTGTQTGNPFFAMPRRKDSDTTSVRSFASSASNLALPVHRVAPLRKAPSEGPESTQIRQRQASVPVITTSSSSMSSTALLLSSSASSASGRSILRRDSAPLVSFPTSGITSSAMSASSSLPHEAYSYSQDYVPSTSDRRPQTQTQTLYRPPPQQQVLSSYKPSSGRPSMRRDATYPTCS